MITDALGYELPQPLPDTDCAGCPAPCCRNFTMGGRCQAFVSDVVQLRHFRAYDVDVRLTKVVRRPGVPLKVLEFTCTKLQDGRSTVYDHRPYACIVYDAEPTAGG